MSGPDGLATPLPGGLVLLGPVGVGYCERALRLVERAAARDGVGTRPQVRELAQLLAAALDGSATGTAEPPGEPDLPVSGAVGSLGAAKHLGITERGVRKLCARGALQAVRVDGRWLIDRADLVAYADQRSRGGAMHGRSDQPGARVIASAPSMGASAPKVNMGMLREALGLSRQASDEQVRGMLALEGLAASPVRRQDCTDVLDTAIKAGKFPPARREHYERLWAADPDGTRSLVASLTAVPAAAGGHRSDDVEQIYAAMYGSVNAEMSGSDLGIYASMYPDWNGGLAR